MAIGEVLLLLDAASGADILPRAAVWGEMGYNSVDGAVLK
jgi:hypothetical protein